MAGVTVKLGRPKGMERVTALLGAGVSRGLAQATVTRVKARVNHPAADALRARGINQYSAVVTGPRGGPGIIMSKKFVPTKGGGMRRLKLRFVWRNELTFRTSVNSAGLLPLIVAEGERLSGKDQTEIVRGITL